MIYRVFKRKEAKQNIGKINFQLKTEAITGGYKYWL